VATLPTNPDSKSSIIKCPAVKGKRGRHFLTNG